MDLKNKKIVVTGGHGFLGSEVVRTLIARGVPKENIQIPRSAEHDLRTLDACREIMRGQDVVIHLAARVGGIGFNAACSAELFYDNLIMGVQIMEAARLEGVKKAVMIGTICAYPKFTPVPFREEDLWNGYPEETNAPYGLAKKAILVQVDAYRKQYGVPGIYLLPVNLYGPGDNFDPKSSHVIPALIKKVIEAKEEKKPFIELWGTGRATREFLFVEDAAEGIVRAAEQYEKADPVNLGSGQEISIRKLIEKLCTIEGYQGELKWDVSKPDGQPRRRLDTSRAKEEFGFEAKVSLDEGLARTIEWYKTKKPGK